MAPRLRFQGPSCIAITPQDDGTDISCAALPQAEYAAISRTTPQDELRRMLLISEKFLV
jgi:hypothetical protein